MNNPADFQDKSYKLHEDHYAEYSKGGKFAEHAKTWMDKSTVDAWRHQRMYQTIDPILNTDPNQKWLTVGDGRYGSDANYILEKGGDVIASDISDPLLIEAQEHGFISRFQKENAEALSFKDDEFDYVLCKESYHHFPRPMLALYEMLRVARKGIVLIEPNDTYIPHRDSEVFLKYLKLILKKLLGMPQIRHDFEESGNYKYSISRREIEKAALGLNFPAVAFKGINDVFYPGVHLEKLSENGPLLKKTTRMMLILDLLCKLRVSDFNILTAIILKQRVSDCLNDQLKKNNYEVIFLPENPYIK